MSIYAHIINRTVVELYTPPAGASISDCFNPALQWVDVTGHVPSVGDIGTQTNGVWTFAAPPAPTVVVPNTVDPEAFLSRFTAAEQQALSTLALSNWKVNWWLLRCAAGATVDVTDTALVAGMAALVTAGVLTAPRSAQVLNLGVTSP